MVEGLDRKLGGVEGADTSVGKAEVSKRMGTAAGFDMSSGSLVVLLDGH